MRDTRNGKMPSVVDFEPPQMRAMLEAALPGVSCNLRVFHMESMNTYLTHEGVHHFFHMRPRESNERYIQRIIDTVKGVYVDEWVPIESEPCQPLRAPKR